MASATALERQQRPTSSTHLIWWPQAFLLALILALTIVDAIWLRVSGVKLLLGNLKIMVALGFFFAAIGWAYALFRPAPKLALPLLAHSQLFLFAVPGCVFSYAMMSIGRPLVDPILATADGKLGFNWVDYIMFVRQHSWLETILHWGYTSFLPQIILVILSLSLSGRYATVNRLLVNILIGAVITSTIGAFYPALGGYYYFNIPDQGVATFVPAIQTCLSGGLSVIDMDHIQGLIQFPSFHAAMSIALIVAAWSLPLLRYPIFILNVIVLLSTPVYGAHYLIDVLAGTVLTIALTLSWGKLECWLEKRGKTFPYPGASA